MVAVMCSQLVDQACKKNNLSFVEMLQPFCKLNTEGLWQKVTVNLTLMLAIVYIYYV